MIDRDTEYGLDQVIGWDNDKADARQYDRPDRTVSFTVETDCLTMIEQCDTYFGVDLTPAELDKLIAWLTEARRMLP